MNYIGMSPLTLPLQNVGSNLHAQGKVDDLRVSHYTLYSTANLRCRGCSIITSQGDLFAPLQAAVQVDSMTRKLEEQDRAREEDGETGLLYKYKGMVSIPSLGLMDDNLTVSEAGFRAEEINIFMNENSATKLLQFNTKKCKYLRMGNLKETSLPNKLEVDSWEMKYDDMENILEN